MFKVQTMIGLAISRNFQNEKKNTPLNISILDGIFISCWRIHAYTTDESDMLIILCNLWVEFRSFFLFVNLYKIHLTTLILQILRQVKSLFNTLWVTLKFSMCSNFLTFIV